MVRGEHRDTLLSCIAAISDLVRLFGCSPAAEEEEEAEEKMSLHSSANAGQSTMQQMPCVTPIGHPSTGRECSASKSATPAKKGSRE